MYLYALLSQPAFGQLIINGSGSSVVKTTADVRGSGVAQGFISPTMISWFRFLFSAVITLLVIVLCAIPFSLADQWANRAKRAAK